MYLPDLSTFGADPRRLSVGWLETGHHYLTGNASDDVLDRVFELCANPAVKTRGFHECPFCPREGRGRRCSRSGKTVLLGSGQIRVRRHGKTYEAPDLVYHYMADHSYRPPDEFIEAVMHPRNWFKRKLDWCVFNSQ